MVEVAAVVLDVGSSSCKVGFAGEERQKEIISSCIGRPLFPAVLSSAFTSTTSTFVGEEAQRVRAILALSYPIQRGIVVNWDDHEKLLHHIFYHQLNIAPEESPTLITEPLLNPKANREKLTQILFETFNVPASYIATSSLLSLYSSARITALVMDVGHGLCTTLSVNEGCWDPTAAQRVDMGGYDVTTYLGRLLAAKGHTLSTSSDFEVLQEMKEKTSYLPVDFQREVEAGETLKTYRLPDGHSLSLGRERFLSAELLLQPHLMGLPYPGIHQVLHRNLMLCEIDKRSEYYGNIVLTGGCSSLEGLAERLSKELTLLDPDFMKHCPRGVTALSERNLLNWRGGSVLASLSSFQSQWLAKEEYDESGPSWICRRPHW